MTDQPLYKFGIWLGEQPPGEGNVIYLDERLWDALPRKFLRQLGSPADSGELPLQYRRFVWRTLNEAGPPPRMRIVVHREAVKAAVETVRARKGPSL